MRISDWSSDVCSSDLGAAVARDVRGLERRGQIVVNDLEGAGIGVVDADRLRAERVLDQLVFNAFVGERASRIEAERLQVAGQHLHRRDAAGLDRLDELGARGEGEVLAAPQAEALGVGEIVDRGGASRRYVEHAGVGQRVLQAEASAALLGRRLIAARSAEHTSELQSLMRISYAVFCLKIKNISRETTCDT